MTISEHQLIARRDSVPPSAEGPTVAVVVASRGPRSWLTACLASLVPQCLRTGAELVVVRADTPSAIAELSAMYPHARFIFAPPRTGIEDLRSTGLAGVSAPVTTLLDDGDGEAVPGAHWLERVRWRARGVQPTPSPRIEGGVSTEPTPRLSVIVPAHQAADHLRHSVEAMCRSSLPRRSWELIVVDDASTDETAVVAAQCADTVVRLPDRRGPAYARNRGFEFARGDYVAFINADVCVHRETLWRFVTALDDDPDISAVFGSYDTHPSAPGIVSQYRNLLLHFYHQQSGGDIETFWAACGVIRRTAFVEVGMFDEWHFPRRQVEDFELGHRLGERGHRISSRPDIQATHLRTWRFPELLTADLQDRTVPWMRVFPKQIAAARKRRSGRRRVKNANTALTWLALGSLATAAVVGNPVWLLPTAACVIAVGVNDRAQHRFFVEARGGAFALAVTPFRLLGYLTNGLAIGLGWLMREVVGEPMPNPSVEAYAEVGVKMWPPVPARRLRRAVDPDSATPRD